MPENYFGGYSTDILAQKAYALLDEAVNADNKKPFFLTLAPIAPHANIWMSGSILDPNPVFEWSAPIPAKRHRHLFSNVKVPRSLNFNPDKVRIAKILSFTQPDQLIVFWSKLDHETSKTK